ncbi:hypothetical protein CWI38_0595p0020 [Hamiltosporidium tvaerminnensis]|uniref:Uncharacterized protein n=1 Tax=Hamiltosporidium tvaerminnensis TaxID=1176355 RepID=A0A4V6MVM8_9MICR|nr:hypothetical protein CWI38_0595p0020 [Hamiltosporidium tvaerminnensis]
MGRRKKVDSENIKNKKIKAVNNLENRAGEILMCDVDVAMLSERLPPPQTFHNTNHQAVVARLAHQRHDKPQYRCHFIRKSTDSIALNTKWLRSAILAVQKRFERMPRNGWPATPRYYNEKFGCTLDIDAFKKLAQNEAEKEIRQEENRERRRIATCLTEPCTLTDTTDKIKEISEKEIGKVVVRTRKLPSELVDTKAHVPESITEAAYIMQTAQVCYDEATREEKLRSAWKENIESKISKLVLSKDLPEKARKQEMLSTSETKSLKKIMREFNLNLSSVTDLSEALVKKNESLNVYEKKITMHESRKQSRKENRMFKLFRGQFYRG